MSLHILVQRLLLTSVHVHILVHVSDQRVNDPLMQTEWQSVVA